MRFPFREIHQFIDAQRNFEYLESHGQFDSTTAGGDLSGNYPNPTVATIGGHTPVTNATAAGGDLQGTYPSPTVATIGGHTPVTNATAAGGDLQGTYPNPTIAAATYTALTLATNVGTAAGSYTPSSRLRGEEVRLKGAMVNNTGGDIAAGATWATVPVGMRPTVGIFLPAIVNGGTAIYVSITTAGLLSISIAGGAGGVVFLDGLTFTIS